MIIITDVDERRPERLLQGPWSKAGFHWWVFFKSIFETELLILVSSQRQLSEKHNETRSQGGGLGQYDAGTGCKNLLCMLGEKIGEFIKWCFLGCGNVLCKGDIKMFWVQVFKYAHVFRLGYISDDNQQSKTFSALDRSETGKEKRLLNAIKRLMMPNSINPSVEAMPFSDGISHGWGTEGNY